MIPAFASFGVANTAATNAPTFIYPPGIAAGDSLLAFICILSGAGPATWSDAGLLAQGFVPLANQISPTAGVAPRGALYAKRTASGAEAGNIVTSLSNSRIWRTRIAIVTDVDQTSATWFEGNGAATGATTATPGQSVVTTTDVDRLAVQVGARGNGFVGRTLVSGYANYTTRQIDGDGQTTGLILFSADVPAPTVLSGSTYTLSGIDDWVSVGAALIGAQAAGGSGAPPPGGSLRRRRARRLADLIGSM